ncbi:MAG: DUF3040 domain-containing protein [Candidatus Nanopelagicales bacterium]
MPLSEHEQRLLEQMERALHEEDPKLASTLRHGSNYTVNGRQVFLGAVGFLLGLCGLLGGVIMSMVVIGVVGFLLMLGGVLFIGSAFRAPKQNTDIPGVTNINDAGKRSKTAKAPKAQKSSGGFMSKMEERWRKRGEGQGF